jgi:hypothetical protein
VGKIIKGQQSMLTKSQKFLGVLYGKLISKKHREALQECGKVISLMNMEQKRNVFGTDIFHCKIGEVVFCFYLYSPKGIMLDVSWGRENKKCYLPWKEVSSNRIMDEFMNQANLLIMDNTQPQASNSHYLH